MRIWTLYDLNHMVRQTLESVLEEGCWLQAELSEVREGYNGHCYLEFVQKDSHGRDLIAKARGTIWASHYRLLKPMFERETGRPLAAGIKVLVKVTVTFHELYGHSLTVTDIDPSYTLGEMVRVRKEILDRLQHEGILDDNKSLSLPFFTNRIAVISAPTAAGYGDFYDQLVHNEYGLSFVVRLYPAVMQGERIEPSVLDALDAIMNDLEQWDAVVIIRGGGATSDLSGFDTYLLAAACAQFPIPIITGIGHERDDTVIDSVAHTRVKTPTAAAAFLLNRQMEVANHLEQCCVGLSDALDGMLELEKMRMERIGLKITSLYGQVRERGIHRVELLQQRMQHAVLHQVMNSAHHIRHVMERLQMVTPVTVERQRQRLLLLEKSCESADPALLLRRGYSMTFCNGRLLRDATAIKAGDEIVTRLSQGEIRSVAQSAKTENE